MLRSVSKDKSIIISICQLLIFLNSLRKLVERVVSSFKDLMLTDEIANEKASVDPVSPLTLTHTQKTNQSSSSRPESNRFK